VRAIVVERPGGPDALQAREVPSRPLASSEVRVAVEAVEAAGLEVTVSGTDPLPAGVEALLSFAAREGTTNVLRHSRSASRCEITVRRVGELAELELRDDGSGGGSAAGQGTGLRGLAERMVEAGGRLDAGPAADGGFRLIARVPIATRARPGRADRDR
jgi:two-component system, NarL family, sensor histidine kinase DesK